jgi:hypothetical protein
VSKNIKLGIPADRICQKQSKKDMSVCELKFAGENGAANAV